MTTTTLVDQLYLQEILLNERPRLQRLCSYLIGDPDGAEDAVQEVLLEAWRSFTKLRNPESLEAWLHGIVRNVCARWRRTRCRESSMIPHDRQIETDSNIVLDTVTEPFDLEVELDRQELALLLDRALALLPPTTREVLIGKYIDESPHAELAQQLGLTENAVTVRLHRGKLALHKLLTTQLRTEAETFGLVTPADPWTVTRLWCPFCGQQHILGKLTETEFALRCPACSVEPDASIANRNWSGIESPFGQMKSFRSVLKRHAINAFDSFAIATARREFICPSCHVPLPLHLHLPDDLPPSMRKFRGMSNRCELCNRNISISLSLFALSSPEGLNFMQAHPRIRMSPEREIAFEGVSAILLSFEGVICSATFDMFVHRDTYSILASYRSDKP